MNEQKNSPAPLDLASLKRCVEGETVAIRSITELEPAGGPGDKIFPPTYVKEGRATTKYALEKRRVGDREVETVLLDSVQSQANRMEEALYDAWKRDLLPFPLVSVDFRDDAELADLDEISTLHAPHRIADAILRDSTLGGKPFRHSAVGRAFSDSRAKSATGMYQYCPTALIFGIWDSTGPKGGMGAKFQRCLVSEIVGFDVVTGVKTSSRLDPAAIEKKAGEIYHHADPEQEWTLNADEAVKEKGKPKVFVRGKGENKGSPAAINHGNIPPSIDDESGGVTIGRAEQKTVLSLAGLRRLHFVTGTDGAAIPSLKRDAAENAARTALAALGLAAASYYRTSGFDLRSRSLLVAKGPQVFELLSRDGGIPETRSLSIEGAAKLLKEAAAEAGKHGLGWERGPILLKPAPKLVQLIKASRKLKQVGEAEGST